MAASVSRRRRQSFARYTRPPTPATISSKPSSSAASRGCATWHVERERPAAQRKRERRAACGAEILQDREVARDAAAVQPVDQPPEHVLRSGRHHELVLHQASPPIQPGPCVECVEWEHVRADALEPSPFPTRSGPEAQLVERAHGGGTHYAPRPTRRHRRAGAHGRAAPERCRDPPAGRRGGRE